jgi:O-methyltransferase
MDNTFILELQEPQYFRSVRKHKKLLNLTAKAIKLFNSHNFYLKLNFKSDALNHYYEIRNPKKLEFKEKRLQGGMTSIEQGINIYHLLCQTIQNNIPGDIVELGCYEGITAILIQKTLDQFNSDKIIHVFDSFEGLPDKSEKDGDTIFKKGSCSAQKINLIENFEKHNAKLPIIHEGWFKDKLPKELPGKICFAHLDGDFYSSIMESLECVYPRLSKDAIVIIDDYCDPQIHNVNNILPGVKRATDEFLMNKPEKLVVLIAGNDCHAYFRKE